MRNRIAVIILIIVLALVNWAIYDKQQLLASGEIVYLRLGPVDPRSLMQGDYMRLRFQLSDQVYSALPKTTEYRRWRHNVAASDGYVVVTLEENRIGKFKALYDGQSLADNELLMRYRVRNGAVKFATNAFFFQEGHAKVYQPARYGQFRVDNDGELLLTGMYDNDLNELTPQDSE